MEYTPNKVYQAKISHIKEYNDKIDFTEYENTTKDGSRKFKSYLCRVQLDKFGDQWFSGFFNESKKHPGTPLIWVNMDLNFTITERQVEKNGTVNTYYNINKISDQKAKDMEIEELKRQLAAKDTPAAPAVSSAPKEVPNEEPPIEAFINDHFEDLTEEPAF